MSDAGPFGPFGGMARSLAKPILVSAAIGSVVGILVGTFAGLLVLLVSPFGVVPTTGLVVLAFMSIGLLSALVTFHRRMV